MSLLLLNVIPVKKRQECVFKTNNKLNLFENKSLRTKKWGRSETFQHSKLIRISWNCIWLKEFNCCLSFEVIKTKANRKFNKMRNSWKTLLYNWAYDELISMISNFLHSFVLHFVAKIKKNVSLRMIKDGAMKLFEMKPDTSNQTIVM